MSEELNLEKIQKLIDLAKKKNLSNFSYESKEVKIAFAFQDQRPVAAPLLPQSNITATPAAALANTTTPALPVDSVDLIEVKAPFVGTFYMAPSPDSPPYVRLGDRVKAGQVLGLVEAMKIMNEIESTIAGTIAEVCCENESFVEYGQVLFRLKK